MQDEIGVVVLILFAIVAFDLFFAEALVAVATGRTPT
jgi:hypothetical protein